MSLKICQICGGSFFAAHMIRPFREYNRVNLATNFGIAAHRPDFLADDWLCGAEFRRRTAHGALYKAGNS